MQQGGTIQTSTAPTRTHVGSVVVPKKLSNAVHICVDLKPLNESVQWENFPLPTVDETLAQLAGAAVCSKIDANCRFWQISLSNGCWFLTTFITPYGRYCFNKLPFSISCGRNVHRNGRCPARNATCFKCQKRGHFANVGETGAKSHTG